MRALKPPEIMDSCIEIGVEKGNASFLKLAVLGILAGAFIAMAASGSNMAAFNLLASPETYGLGRAVAGALFTVGLMLVVAAGGELFTGNVLMFGTVLEKKLSILKMLRNWLIVYVFNLIGSLLVAYMVFASGLLDSGDSVLGVVTLKTAVAKTNLEFLPAFYLGILCNWLVCLGVWIACGAKTITGKLWGCFFPIWLFVTSGYEHSVANMFYIPAGLFAKSNQAYVDMANINPELLNQLTISGFVGNLIPVTLGNIVGGSIMVAGAYWLAYKKATKQTL